MGCVSVSCGVSIAFLADPSFGMFGGPHGLGPQQLLCVCVCVLLLLVLLRFEKVLLS